MDIYPADPLGTYSKPFLGLESTSLLSLRSSMNSEPLSAYILLLVSDIGHHFHVFNLHSLNILFLLAGNEKFEAIFLAFCYVLPSFSLDSSFYEDERFLHITNILFGYQYHSESFSSIREIFLEYIDVLQKSEKEEIILAIDFWHKIIFSLQTRICSDLGMFILDYLSHMCFESRMSRDCQESLYSIYKNKILQYKSFIGEDKLSITNPIASIYSLKTYFTRKYPEIVPPIEDQFKGRAWFALDGYLAEVRACHNDRKLIGLQLLRSVSEKSDIGVTLLSPNSYSIFRLAKEFSILKPNHSLAPIYLNLFFSLYFESLDLDCSTSQNQVFGHLTLMDSKSACIDLVALFIKKSVRILDDLDNGHDLKHAYNAFLLWLNDSSLLREGLSSSTISEDYMIDKLADCFKGDILKSGKYKWTDILPFSPVNDSSTKGVSQLDKFQVEYVQLNALPVVKTLPVLSLHSPMVTKFSFSLDNFFSKVAIAINILTSKAEEFQKMAHNIQHLEIEYVEKLKLLYTSSTIRNRAQKTCGKDCKSPAMFDYITYKIIAVSEVKLMLFDNRATKEDFLNADIADSEICLLGLELGLMVEWVKNQCPKDLDSIIGSEICFGILEAVSQDQNLAQFQISHFILKNIISSLGKYFISSSSEKNLKLWKLMTKPVIVEMVVSVFCPSFAIEQFNMLYLDLASRFESLGDDLTHVILSNFNVGHWLGGNVSNDQIFEFFTSLISWPIHMEIGPKSFVANIGLLSALLSHQSFHPMIMDAVCLSFSRIISGQISVIIFNEVSNSLFLRVPEIWQSSLTNLDLLESHCGRDQLVLLIGKLNTRLKSFIRIQEVSILDFDKDIQNSIVRLLALLFCSKQIYSMIISFYFEELYNLWLSLYLATIGIVEVDGCWKNVTPWPIKDYEKSKMIILNLNLILEKLCRNSSQMGKMPSFFWNIITIILQLNVADEFSSCLFSTFESRSCWEGFQISPDVIIVVKNWIIEKKMTSSLTKCLITVLELSSLDEFLLESSYDSIQDVLFVVIFLINQSHLVFSETNDRARLLLILEEKLYKYPWTTLISAATFASLIDQLVFLKWNTLSSQIYDWKSSADPLVFTINFLQNISGIQKYSCRDEFYISYRRFIISLFSNHIFNHDSWNEALSDEDITDIVYDFLNFAEKLKNKRVCQSGDLGFFGFKEFIGIFNRMSKNHDLYVKIWNGCLKVICDSTIPLEYLSCSSSCFSSGDFCIN